MAKATTTAWNHIRRSPYQALAAVFIIMQAFFVISFFAYIIAGSHQLLTYVGTLPQAAAFFKQDTKQESIDQLKQTIQNTGKAEEIRFVSQEEALTRYRKLFKDDPLLLDLVSADVLPASLEISTKKVEDLSSISDILTKSPYVQDVNYPKEVVSGLVVWTDILRKIGIVSVSIMVLDSVFIMAIILGIKISQKKEEIEIMRLLSASNWYIRRPFIWEGIFYSVTGAVFGWLFASAGLLYSVPFLQSKLGGVPLLPASPPFLFGILGIELVVAVVLGWFASFITVLRYLK